MSQKIIIGVDGANVRSGGGVTYLVELMASLDPVRDNFQKVVVWGSRDLENKIVCRDWIKFKQQKLLNMMLPFRLYWQAFFLKRELIKENCNILFVPGALILTNFSPVVTVCQNMLPFESAELSRFGFSLTSFKLLILRVMHARSFKKADGIIFLTKYAENYIKKSAQILSKNSKIINHGISLRFKGCPRPQYDYSDLVPFEFLYVSTVDFYKHQWNVIEAISVVRNMGFNVSLKLIGGGNSAAIKKMSKCISKFDPLGCWITYMGEVEFNKLPDIYKKADVGIFASTCENLPITLLEKMYSGLPMISSGYGPMKEVLGDSGEYFDPMSIDSMVEKILLLVNSKELRGSNAKAMFLLACKYSWKKCAIETALYLNNTLQKSK